MNTVTINATSLKHTMPPTSSTWRDRCYQGQYSESDQKLGVILFSNLRDGSIDWANQCILSINLSLTFDGAGSNSQKTLSLYKGTKNSISGSGNSMKGDFIGNVLTNGTAYNSTRIIYFNSETNSEAFLNLSAWITSGNTNTLVTWRDEQAYGHAYSTNYLAIKAATMSISYEAAGSYGELDYDSLNVGETQTLRISPVEITGTITHSIVWKCGEMSTSPTILSQNVLTTSWQFPLNNNWISQIQGTSGQAICQMTTIVNGQSTSLSEIPFIVNIPTSWGSTASIFSIERYSSYQDSGVTKYKRDPMGEKVWVNLNIITSQYNVSYNNPTLTISWERDDHDAQSSGSLTPFKLNTTNYSISENRSLLSNSFNLSHGWIFRAVITNGHMTTEVTTTIQNGNPIIHISGDGANVCIGGFAPDTGGTNLFSTMWPTYGFFDVVYDTRRHSQNFTNGAYTDTDVLTMPIDGLFLVVANVRFTNGSTGSNRIVLINYTRNGTDYELGGAIGVPKGGIGARANVTNLYEAKAGDTLKLQVYQDNGSTMAGDTQLVLFRIGGSRLT